MMGLSGPRKQQHPKTNMYKTPETNHTGAWPKQPFKPRTMPTREINIPTDVCSAIATNGSEKRVPGTLVSNPANATKKQTQHATVNASEK